MPPSGRAVWLTVCVASAAVAGCDRTRTHPRAADPVDPAYAIGWDTAPWIGRLGNCFDAAENNRPSPGWRPQPGRYILTIVDTTARPRPRLVRGRLWLALTGPEDRSPATGEQVRTDDTREHPLVGATNFPFDSLGLPPAATMTGAPPAGSFDPLRPGVLVTYANHAMPGHDPDFTLQIGTPMNIRDAATPDVPGGLVLAIRDGGGDGFVGMWGLRGAGRLRRGFFCAGWIDV